MESGFNTGWRLHQMFLHLFPVVDTILLQDEYGGYVEIWFKQDSATGEVAIKEVNGPVTGLVRVSLDLLEIGSSGIELNLWEGRLWLGPALMRIIGYDPLVGMVCCEWVNYKELGYGDSK